MGSTGKAFDEVKAILGKLDRSIDQARSRRLGPDETPEEAGDGDELIGRREEDGSTVVGGNQPVRPAAPNKGRARPASEYGRARPLRRDGEPAPDKTGQWEKKEIGDDTVIG
ncbi:MAG: hypothetical protein ACF8Q5_08590 [Phycisphaerales bacterium JB040]